MFFCRFRRLRNASSGLTSAQLIERLKKFFGYMEKYFPSEALSSQLPPPSQRRPRRPPPHSGGSRTSSSSSSSSGSAHHHHHRMSAAASVRVQFSKMAEESSVDGDSLDGVEGKGGGVNISQQGNSRHSSMSHAPNGTTTTTTTDVAMTMPSHYTGGGGGVSSSSSSSTPSASRQSSMVDELGFEHVQFPTPSIIRGPNATSGKTSKTETPPNQWLNSLAARLCWDVWHEHRWKDWVMTRIQKKLIRTKTPSFMEKLRLTDINIGNDMPTVNRLIGGPRLDLRGIWVYLDVTYQGKFVMTIETKMKLGGKGESDSTGGGGREEEGRQMTAVTRSKEDDSRCVF